MTQAETAITVETLWPGVERGRLEITVVGDAVTKRRLPALYAYRVVQTGGLASYASILEPAPAFLAVSERRS